MNNNNDFIQLLTESNYKKLKQDIEFSLGIMDLDICLLEDEPASPTDSSTTSQRSLHAQWEKSNRLSLIAMKRNIPEHLLSGLPDTKKAKEFFIAMGKMYDTDENAKINSLLDEILSIKYDESKGVRDFIMKFVHFAIHDQKLLN
ncbi:uncharacterized protein LOC133832545 [Humulus lupulus]|uniref:uncharacterized protein LOC133832545 n=1 Tax=Humulus lupulus TaxID=3486 RepID=UPI002B4117C7|nr:uncharacterized protein LOC133832545 [Humulus lupulus]